MAEQKNRKKTQPGIETLGLEIGNRPPQAIEAEEAVLGAMLLEPSIVDSSMAELSKSCFYDQKNQMIFEAMSSLVNEHTPIDIITVSDRLKAQGFLDQHIPDKEKLDLIEYRSVALGILFLSFTIITGAIWAERAWGSYWSWDPKETWSLVTWIIYAVYLHLRIRRGYKGKSAAIFAVIGFVCVLFTYVGVNTFLPGVHSYK